MLHTYMGPTIRTCVVEWGMFNKVFFLSQRRHLVVFCWHQKKQILTFMIVYCIVMVTVCSASSWWRYLDRWCTYASSGMDIHTYIHSEYIQGCVWLPLVFVTLMDSLSIDVQICVVSCHLRVVLKFHTCTYIYIRMLTVYTLCVHTWLFL